MFCCYARTDWPRFQREINLKLDLLNPEVNTEAKVDATVEFLTSLLDTKFNREAQRTIAG